MYSALLRVHSIVRWLIIIAGLLAAVRAWRPSSSPGPVKAPAAGLFFAHLGRAASRGGVEDRVRRRRAAIYVTLAIVIVLITVPWPFMAYGRPLI